MKISPLITSSISRAVVLTLLTEIVNYFEPGKSKEAATKSVADKLPMVLTGATLLSPVLKNKKLLLYGSAVIVVAGLITGLLNHSATAEKSSSL
jgi:hypothetical protein